MKNPTQKKKKNIVVHRMLETFRPQKKIVKNFNLQSTL